VSTSSRDEVRRFALLKAELLAAARAAIEKLTDDQCEVIYVEIEQRLTTAVRDTSSVPVEEEVAALAPATALAEESAPTTDLPISVVKRRAAEDIERDYLADLMKQANGSVTVAARLADEDRTNFRRRLQRAGLRARGQMKPGPKYTDQILKILDEHKIGLRTYEIAERTGQTVPNAFRILKLLETQGRAVRHGKRTSTLWTLPGAVPTPRIETVQAVIVDVLSKSGVPMDRRVLEIQVDRVLREKGRKLKPSTLMSEIGRLVEKGIVAFHGANEHGPLFALTVPEGECDVN
jgi:hypothetical protein